jgi:hypothetical protein
MLQCNILLQRTTTGMVYAGQIPEAMAKGAPDP